MPRCGAISGLTVCVSDAHARCATLPEMAALLLAENPGPLILVGTSMGGILALELWRQGPQRVQAMALLGSSARPDTPELIALRTQACELFAAGRMGEVLRANLAFAFHPDSLAVQPALFSSRRPRPRASWPQASPARSCTCCHAAGTCSPGSSRRR